ncbi:MAG: leucyl/phenylalanyl-tRNA--protein transferase [Flavobacteriaceae bacterium]|nr:leucyl/phenylalanyl-tRNA--protein transferase [Flavobacteriaceae bacterium]
MKKKQNPLIFLGEKLEFPPIQHANAEGLLAVGGDLSVKRLMLAYRNGIFPWFNEDALILWWSPDPRMVLFPDKVKISKSMRRLIHADVFEIRVNTAFEEVIKHCAAVPRAGQRGTWITDEMTKAYLQLHHMGIAKSYEVWQDGKLVGGLYGVDLGHVFCGESMFSLVDNASKFALIKLAQELHEKGYGLIDCQLYTSHLESMGAEEISREVYMELLKGKDKGCIHK